MPENLPENLPIVSLLIAARNEESQLGTCLASVARLNYPKHKLQVLIGDDNSTDKTAEIALKFVDSDPNFRLVEIKKAESDSNLQGKTNVLQQLSELATGEFLFFTDADISLNPDWIVEMLNAFGPKTGIVTGLTLVNGKGWFNKFQALDWGIATSVIALFAYLKIPVTAIGNNMAISRKAWEAVDGYKNIPFSVTEDHAIFMAIVGKGFGFAHPFSKEVLSLSSPQPNVGAWINQHKRWMHGAIKLPIYIRSVFFGQLGWYPVFLTSFALGWKPGIIFATVRYLLVTLYGIMAIVKTRQWPLLKFVPLYDPLFCYFYSLLSIRFLKNRKIEWKGREYEPFKE